MKLFSIAARAALPLILVAGISYDISMKESDEKFEEEIEDLIIEPVVDQKNTLTSTWFCPAVHLRRINQKGIEATADLTITNFSAEPVRVAVELVSATSANKFKVLEVPGFEMREVELGDVLGEELVSALIEASAGAVAVTRKFTSELGADESPCTNVLAESLFALGGSSQLGDVNEIVLYNPLSSDAIVDFKFATEAETGIFSVPELEGVVVPAGGNYRVDVGEAVRRRDTVATWITTRVGKVVADYFQTFDGVDDDRGFSTGLAGSNEALRWTHSLEASDPAKSSYLQVYNPTELVAEITISSGNPEGRTDGQDYLVGPFDVLTLPISMEAPAEGSLEVALNANVLIVESPSRVPVVSGLVTSLKKIMVSHSAGNRTDEALAKRALFVERTISSGTSVPRLEWAIVLSHWENSNTLVTVSNLSGNDTQVKIKDIGGEEIDGGLLEANSTVRLLYDYVSAALVVSAKHEILVDVIRESKSEKLLSSSPKLGF